MEGENNLHRAEPVNNQENNPGVFNGLGAVHQALLPREGPIGIQPYQKPTWFYARLLGENMQDQKKLYREER